MRGYLINGFWWIGFRHEGKLLLLRKVGKSGDCISLEN
jgi:hypothetical protein